MDNRFITQPAKGRLKMAHDTNTKVLSLVVVVVKLHLFQVRGGLPSKAGEALWCHLMYNRLPQDIKQASPWNPET